MCPRKKSKPNPKAATESQPTLPGETSQAQTGEALDGATESKASQVEGVESQAEESDAPAVLSKPEAQSDTRKSWYGGTWPRTPKATPVTQVAKESISAAGAVASEAILSAQRRVSPRRATPGRKPSLPLGKDFGGSTRSLPLAATTTKLHITSSPSDTGSKRNSFKESPIAGNAPNNMEKPEQSNSLTLGAEEGNRISEEQSETKGSTADRLDAEDKIKPEDKGADASSGWMGWFLRNANNTEQSNPKPMIQLSEPSVESNPATQKSFNNYGVAAADTGGPKSPEPIDPAGVSHKGRRNSDPNPISPTAQEPASRSWLGLWNYAAPTTRQENSTAKDLVNAPNPPEAATSTKSETNKPGTIPPSDDKTPEQPPESGKSYGWAFWSKEPSNPDSTGKSRRTSTGELAVAGSPSQSKPETTEIDETKLPKRSESKKRPRSLETNAFASKVPTGKDVERKAPKSVEIASSLKLGKDGPPVGNSNAGTANLLLPPLDQTYCTIEKPGLLQQMSRLLQYSKAPLNTRHVHRQDPPRIKRAMAIGVHGYFPAPLIRSVLGQPTGTSIRFANGAANAIQHWTASQGYSCEVEKVALEGEGKIAERLDLLWKLLLNWLEDIRKADFVMIACHSQGVPVAIMLIAKLISFGCLNSARIGVCAMAGVNLGPFGDYKSRWISGTAGELFDFARPESQVSKDYEAALDVVLKFGVRITYVGSIDDQLVSLESSTFGTISHPYIYRAVFVDGRVHAPDFLSHLVGFVLRLRNLGLKDHGLIRELSTPLAGSLYGGEGHSRIYDDDAVYGLAVQYALETTSIGNLSPQLSRDVSANSQNPYILPFAMRGLLEEDYVKTELHKETTELLKQFDDWKPSSKVLKDVKFRLEGVRSKL